MNINSDTRLFQVKSALLEYIRKNNLKRNAKLPSESLLASTLGVSRNTLREAYISLESEGVIVRRHGIGTFIANVPRIQDSLNTFFPFAHIILEKGYTPRFKTLSMQFDEAGPDVAEGLNLKQPVQVRCIKRLVYADQQPAIYVIDYLSPAVECYQIDWDAFHGNIVQILSACVDPPLHQIKSYIRAVALDASMRTYFDLPENKPLLAVESTIYSLDNKPITYSKIYFNSDIVELTTVRIIPKT